MLQFKNSTPFNGTILLMPDPDGIDSLYTVVKATFSMGESVELADQQVPVSNRQEHHGEPDASSIRVPSDISLMKPGTDVLLIGHAYAPGGRSTTEMDVSVSVGPVHKRVRVFGDRVWRLGAGLVMSRPAAFDTMPLVWERAYGGVIASGDERQEEARNPVGCGLAASMWAGGEIKDELWLPNLEDPSDLISVWNQRPVPACFAPIAAHWEPRRSYAGTYDERWQQEQAPYLPDDFDPRFFQLAPPGLVAPGHFKGGESVEVAGASSYGVLRFRLPVVDLAVTYVLDSEVIPRPAVLDTVVIEPDLDRLQLVWRAVLPCDKKALRVSEVHASLGQLVAA